MFVAGAMATIAAFPSQNSISWFAWIAFVPYFILIQNGSLFYRCVIGLNYGVIYIIPKTITGIYHAIHLAHADVLKTCLLTVTFFLPYIVPFALCAMWWRLSKKRIVNMLSQSTLLTIFISWIHGVFPFTPAYMLFDQPWMIQSAEWGGTPLVLCILMFANALMAEIILRIRRKEPVLKLVMNGFVAYGVIIIYGGIRAGEFSQLELQDQQDVHVMAVQSNIEFHGSLLSVTRNNKSMNESLIEQTRSGLKQYRQPDIIVWPEAPIDTTQSPHWEHLMTKKVSQFAKENQIPILFGLYETVEDATPTRFYNSVKLAESTGEARNSYQKNNLVPFYEYDPFGVWNPLIHDGNLLPGQQLNVFELISNIQIIPAICYEIYISNHIRNGVLQGGTMIINHSNLASFKTSNLPYADFAMTVFRAVEYRRPLVKVSNMGCGAYVEASGIIHPNEIVPPYKRKAVFYKIKPSHIYTPYFWLGDFFLYALTCFMMGYSLLPLWVGKPFRAILK